MKRDDEDVLTQTIVDLASEYGRYGYRRVTALLRARGWHVNHKRVERIWRREGLKVPTKQPKRARLWLNDGSCVRLRPTHRHHVWSYDFVMDRTHDGRAFRMLTVIDEYSRECLAIRSAPSADRTRRLSLRRYPICFCYTDLQSTCAQTMALSSPQRRCVSGFKDSKYKHSSSNRAALGRTATTKASTVSCAMSCSTAKSFLRCEKHKYSWNNGACTTTPSGHTVLWATDHQHRRACNIS